MAYGYHPSPQNLSYQKFSTVLAPVLKMASTGDVDLRPFCTDSDQRSLNACAGNSSVDSVEILNAIEGRPPVQLSRLFAYTLARNENDSDGDGKTDIDKDDGTYIHSVFDVLSRFGVCREDVPAGQGGWPYDESKVHVLPDLMAMRSAIGHKIHSYYRIDQTGQDRIDAMLQALRSNHPIVFGTTVDKAFEGLGTDTPWVRTGVGVGGHAMVVVGYLSALNVFIVKNSWGSGWGIGGFCYMKPEVFLAAETQDLWVPTLGVTFQS